jgi:hypothetical protein
MGKGRNPTQEKSPLLPIRYRHGWFAVLYVAVLILTDIVPTLPPRLSTVAFGLGNVMIGALVAIAATDYQRRKDAERGIRSNRNRVSEALPDTLLLIVGGGLLLCLFLLPIPQVAEPWIGSAAFILLSAGLWLPLLHWLSGHNAKEDRTDQG